VAVSSYESEIEIMKTLYAEELALRDDTLKSYEETLNQLQEDYNNTREDLAEARKDRVERHVRDFEKQPEVLADKISETFGLEYVE
jgi:site-specific recombinase XerD